MAKFGETEIKILIESKNKVFVPDLIDSVKYTTDRMGRPGRLEFSVYNSSRLNISHGDVVYCHINGQPFCKCFVFRLEYSQKSKKIDVLAYDQIRYLQNDCSYVFEDKQIAEIFTTVCTDLGLCVGECDNTETIISADGAPVIFNSVPALKIIMDCIEHIRRVENRMLVLYDDFGKLCLKDASSMASDYLITPEISEDIVTSTNIDERTYNRIRLTYGDGNPDTADEVTIVDGKGQEDIGILAITHKIEENKNGNETAEDIGKTILKAYNAPIRKLELQNVIGEPLLRAGMFVPVSFTLDIHVLAQAYFIRTITHNINKGVHTMNITLEGHDIL